MPKINDPAPAPDAMTAFLEGIAIFQQHVTDLGAMLDSHFGTDPDAISWGDVGTLREWNALLARVTDQHYKRGEHAEDV